MKYNYKEMRFFVKANKEKAITKLIELAGYEASIKYDLLGNTIPSSFTNLAQTMDSIKAIGNLGATTNENLRTLYPKIKNILSASKLEDIFPDGVY